MASEPPKYTPTSIEKVFELLDDKLVSLGISGGLGAVGINHIREGKWTEAIGCFAGAAGVWLAIKVGKKLAPKLDQGLDGLIATVETSISKVRADFTGNFLRQQAHLNAEFITEGFNPDRTAIPLLEEVFIPLELSGAVTSEIFAEYPNIRNQPLSSKNLTIWELLRRSQHERVFRQMVIQAKGGMGKTTLLRHLALIYGKHKHRRHRAPKLVPILLRLRTWADELANTQNLSLPKLITDYQIPKLWEGQDNPPTPPADWAKNLLTKGQALIMFDGFDEVPEAKRGQVSEWLSQQMQQYGRSKSVFILTSRPAGYRDYTAKKPAIPLFIKPFTPTQQETFIQRWYLCQEKCCRSQRQWRQARDVAQNRAHDLITQLQTRREDLGYMAENPLLLNMLVTFHRLTPEQALPRQRLELYRGICKLQLDDRPRARNIPMPLDYPKSEALLQRLALGLVNANRLQVKKKELHEFLAQQPLLTEREVTPQEWLTKIVEVSELLVEREPGEYEFPHASFQGFFAATQLAQAEDNSTIQKNIERVLQNWNAALWRETVLLYTAQLPPRLLNQVIRKACEQGSEAAQLATLALKEYPRPDKLSNELTAMLQTLTTQAQSSKYQKLEALLKAQQWRDADKETYRLMITTVGKEEGQGFDPEDLLNFPCEDLKAIDGLWVKYSQGKFGFSVQKQIYVETGNPLDGEYHEETWKAFVERVGWLRGGEYLNYADLQANPSLSPSGELPLWVVGWLGRVGGGFLFSRMATCKL